MSTYEFDLLYGKQIKENFIYYDLDCNERGICIHEKGESFSEEDCLQFSTIRDMFSFWSRKLLAGSIDALSFDGKTLKTSTYFAGVLETSVYVPSSNVCSRVEMMEEIKQFVSLCYERFEKLHSVNYARFLHTIFYDNTLSFPLDTSFDSALFWDYYKEQSEVILKERYRKQKEIWLLKGLPLRCAAVVGVNLFFFRGMPVAPLLGLDIALSLVLQNFQNHIIKTVTASKMKKRTQSLLSTYEDELEMHKTQAFLESHANQNNVDPFIEGIKQDMELVNQYKYSDYEEHLKALYKIASDYIKAKQDQDAVTPYDVFSSSSVLSDLATIETRIQQKIQEAKKKHEGEDALEELARISGIDGQLDEDYQIPPSSHDITLKL